MVKDKVSKLKKFLSARPKFKSVRPVKVTGRKSTSQSTVRNVLLAEDSFFKN